MLGWFFLTGSFFLTTVVLPFVGSRAGVEIAADRVELSLFQSRIAFRNFRIGPESRPIFFVERMEGAFQAETLKGVPVFSDVSLHGAELTLYYHAGTGRWSALPPEEKSVGDEELAIDLPPKAVARAPFRIDLSNVMVRDSRLRMIFGEADAGSAFELAELNFNAERFANGMPFSISGESQLRFASSRANHIDSGTANFMLDSELGSNLAPEKFQGKFLFSSLFGSISGESLNDGLLEIGVRGGFKDKQLKLEQFTLTQSQGGKVQSDVVVSGEAKFQPFEIAANVDVRRLSEDVTSLLFDLGFHFNPGRAVMQYQGKFSYGSRRLAATGRLRADRSGDAIFGLERIVLPPFRLDGEHDFEIDLENSMIDLRKFQLALSETGSKTALFQLRNPIQYSWLAGEHTGGQRAVFDFECNSLDLKLLRFLTPGGSAFRFNTGNLTSKMQLTLRHNLSAVSLLGSGKVGNVSCRWDGRDFELSELQLGLDMDLRRDLHWALRNLSVAFKTPEAELGSANFSGAGELTDIAGKLSGKFERLTPELAAWLYPSFAPFLPEYRKLRLGALEVNVSLEKPSGSDPVILKNLSAGIDRDGTRVLELKTATHRFDGVNSGDLKVQLTGQLPVTAFSPWLKERSMRVEEGSIRLALEGSIAHDFRSTVFSGDLSFEELALTVGAKEFRGFSGQCAFSGYVPDTKLLEFRTLNFYLRRSGKPALRLECPGVWDFGKESYNGEWSIRYLNDQFWELIVPGAVSEAQLTGKIRVSAQENFQIIRAAFGVDLTKLVPVTVSPSRPLSGSMSFVMERDERRLLLRQIRAGLRQDEMSVFQLDGECRMDLTSPEGAITAQLAASDIDASKLLALLPKKNGNTVKNGEETIPQLDFGPRPVDFDCRLSKIRFTPELTAALSSRVHLRRDSIASEQLKLEINKARYQGEFRGVNTVRGIAFSTELRGSDPLSLPPLIELIVGSPQTGAEGTLRALNLNLRFLEGGGPESYLETMSGMLEMDFQEIRIPNNVTNGTYAKLLLFPIELASQLDTILPDDLAAWKERVVEGNALKRQLRTVELSAGKVRLHAADGRVRVSECSFFGDWVSRLVFSGDFDLFGDRALRLVSVLTVGGIQTTIPIEGVLESPLVKLGAVASGSLKTLLRKISELQLIGTSADPRDPNKVEPVIMIDKLPSAGTIRELQQLFKGLWKN